jgi:hypothetical protein
MTFVLLFFKVTKWFRVLNGCGNEVSPISFSTTLPNAASRFYERGFGDLTVVVTHCQPYSVLREYL